MGSISTKERVSVHPLNPLSADELEAAATILRDSHPAFAAARFVSIGLDEPAKDQVLGYVDGAEIDRRAFMVVRDSAERRTYEVVVSLTERRVVSLEHVPEAQTALTEQDFLDAERLLKGDDRWQEAMRKRGVTDFEHAMIDPWPAAYLTDEDAPTRRLNRPLTFVRPSDGENGYAHPVEGLVALVDLDRGEVLDVVDHGVVDIPPASGEYTTEGMRKEGNVPRYDKPRTDLKPLEITQPDGPSFQVDGFEVRWQKWRFRVGFTPVRDWSCTRSATKTGESYARYSIAHRFARWSYRMEIRTYPRAEECVRRRRGRPRA